MNQFVIFHDRGNSYCSDGLYAAYAASLALPDAVLVPQVHPFKTSPVTPQSGDTVYCVDICPPERIARQWVDTGVSLVVLDHHPVSLSSGFLHKDVARSGAVIAWEYFHETPVPEMFRYVQDRDLWQKKLPGCDLVALAISELTYEQPLRSALEVCHTLTVEAALTLGSKIQGEINKAVSDAVARHSTRCVAGRIVPYVKAVTKREFQARSEIGNELTKTYGTPAIVQVGNGWTIRGEGARELAQLIGGGGHPKASGARADLPW